MEGEQHFGQFSLGGDTHVVPMKLHQETRAKILKKIRETSSDLKNAAALFDGGKSETRYDTDHEPVFRQESYFHYLFGVREPDFSGLIHIDSGESYLFIPRLPESYAIWMGTIQPPSHYKQMYSVDHCYYVDEIASVLKELRVSDVLLLHGTNTDSGNVHAGATFDGIDKFNVNKTILFPICQEARSIKTPLEIELMRYVCHRSGLAHMEVMRQIRPGKMEYELESLFRHVMYAESGCRHMSYTCICASGPHGAVLHYGHSGAPNARQYHDGEMMMFDMGGEYDCYGADISRSYPCNGKFTDAQREIYTAVLTAADAVLAACKPGVSYPDMHRLALRKLCEKLKEYGYLKGEIDDMMNAHIGPLFMPHGLGHLLGIDTHDVGGYLGDMKRATEPGLRNLRLGRILEEGMILTVEPGCYFVKALLEPAIENEEQAKFLNIEKIQGMMNFGGVRIEDDCLITKDGLENLSPDCPRTIEGIEKLMAEGRKEKP